MSEGRLVKMEVDYSATVDEVLPECQELAKAGEVKKAFEKLLSVEKKTRMSGDALSTGRVLKTIVQLCFDLRDWDLLNEHIVLLSKRRAQLKTAVAAMVEEACKLVDQTPDKDTKLKLISTLRTVTEGKIYVEVPRARLTMELAKMTESDGDISKAADILQELQVETYGSMEREEKVLFVIEQMRLCLAKKDYIRAQIISKKVSTKFFLGDTETIQDLKLRYYHLMIQMCQHSKSYLDICRHYRSIFDTPKVQAEEQAWKEALKNAVLYVLLAPHNNEQSDLLHRIYEEKKLSMIPLYKNLMECFRRQELLNWSMFQASYTAVLREGLPEEPATAVFAVGTDEGDMHWKDFEKKLIEHNLCVLAKYYTRISLSRLSQLLSLNEQESEVYISDLVTKKTIYARIDRPAGVVSFSQTQDPSEILNEWSTNLSNLMTLVSKTTHLINKEEMVHRLVK